MTVVVELACLIVSVPLPVEGLSFGKSLMEMIGKKDFLVSTPYQSYDYIIHFLREAAIDPKVKEISIALYRMADHSHVIHALINAAKNGKKVNIILFLNKYKPVQFFPIYRTNNRC